MPQPRIGLVTLVTAVFLSFSMLTRLLLFLVTPKGAGLTLTVALKAVATGSLFDVATLSYLLLPVALYLLLAPRRMTDHRWHPRLIKFFFALFVAALCFDLCAEYLFFEEFGTRFNFIAVDYLIYTTEVIANIRESYPLLPILSAIATATISICLLLNRRLDGAIATTFRGTRRGRGLLLLLPSLFTLGWVNVSQTEVTANSFANELAGNGIYNLVAAFRNNELSFSRFYRTDADERVLTRLKTLVAERNNHYLFPDHARFTRKITGEGPEKRLNVIVVVEESLSAEYLRSFGNRQNLTPNLDQLAKDSLLFTGLYATGTRTVRGLEALTLSVPPLPGTSIVKRPNNDGFRSWGEIMNGKGYDSKFIYGGFGYFDNMNAFFSGNGFRIVDRSSFSRDEITFANAWGTCDEDLFRKTIKEAGKSYLAGKRFFSMVMTTSNHRPFTYPDGRIDVPSRSGREGGVKYADYAIGRFLAEARREPWFRDTVFVFVADHCAGSAGKTELPFRKYEIPLLVYSPLHIKPGVVDRLMSQIDVAPTVLGLLNMTYETDFLGRDLLKDSGTNPRAFISTYQKMGYFTGNRLLVLGPRQQVAQYEVDRASGESRPGPVDPRLLGDALAYYQGGNYIYQHKLNRIH